MPALAKVHAGADTRQVQHLTEDSVRSRIRF